MATISTDHTVARNGSDLARRTTVGVLVAVLAVLVVQGLVDLLAIDVGAAGAQSPFAAVPLVMTSLVAGVGAAIAYALLVRVTARPARNFTVLAAVVFAGMMVPVLSFAPTMGVTAVGQVVLTVFHVTVAVSLVAFVTGRVRI